MPVLVLLQRWVLGPSDSISLARSFAYAYGLVNVALAAIPEDQRIPRPLIISAPEYPATRVAHVIADTLISEIAMCEALAEAIDRQLLDQFADRCLANHRPVIIVSHGPTIKEFVAAIIARSGRPYRNDLIGELPRDKGVVIDTDTLTVSLINTRIDPFGNQGG